MLGLGALTRDQRLLILNSILTGFGVGLFAYLQPLYIASLGASPEQIGLVLSLSGLSVTLLYIPVGLWADRGGRKTLIVAGWGMSALMTFAMALAPDWRWFIPAYTLYLLSNFAVPVRQGYVAATTTPHEVGQLFAQLAFASAVGSVIAPSIGGWLGEWAGLRVVYGVAGAVFAMDTVLVLNSLTPQPQALRTDQSQLRSLLGRPRFRLEVAFIFLMFVATDIGTVMVPNFLETVRGLRVSEIGALGSLGTLGIAGLTFVFSRLTLTRRRPLFFTQATALFALALWITTGSRTGIGLAFLISGGNRVFRPIVSGRLASTLGPETMSAGFGFFQTAQQLGLALSPLIAGWLFERDPYWPLYAGAAVLVIAMAVTPFLPRYDIAS